jgi:hypothetical protein
MALGQITSTDIQGIWVFSTDSIDAAEIGLFYEVNSAKFSVGMDTSLNHVTQTFWDTLSFEIKKDTFLYFDDSVNRFHKAQMSWIGTDTLKMIDHKDGFVYFLSRIY